MMEESDIFVSLSIKALESVLWLYKYFPGVMGSMFDSHQGGPGPKSE